MDAHELVLEVLVNVYDHIPVIIGQHSERSDRAADESHLFHKVFLRGECERTCILRLAELLKVYLLVFEACDEVVLAFLIVTDKQVFGDLLRMRQIAFQHLAYCVYRFVLDYDGAASLENLKTINKINAPALSTYMTVEKAVKKFVRKTLKALRERSFTGMHIIALAFICVFMLLAVRPKSWIYIPLIGALTVALYITIYYMQRTNYRAFYVADVSATLWLLYVIMAEGKEPERKAWRKWSGRLLCILAAAALLTLFPKAVKIEEAKAAHNIDTVASEEVTAYLESHPDKFYIMPTPIQKWPATYLNPLAPAKMQDNCTNTGGWEAMTPSRLDFLAEHGMSNPVKDLIDSPDALMFGKYKKDMLLEYYNKWYGSEDKTIAFEQVDEVGDIPIYKVVSVD